MQVTILGTGGTIEKTYDETNGTLANQRTALGEILATLRLPDLRFLHVPLMCKDSLEMTFADREQIVNAVRSTLEDADAVVIVHGTDTLSVTGELLVADLVPLEKPVILTGAMRPFQFRDSDAYQNITEALLACRLVSPGVYAVFHNQVLAFPGVRKDRVNMTFIRDDVGAQ